MPRSPAYSAKNELTLQNANARSPAKNAGKNVSFANMFSGDSLNGRFSCGGSLSTKVASSETIIMPHPTANAAL